MLGRCVKLSNDPRNTFLKCARLCSFSYSNELQEKLFPEIMRNKFEKFPSYELKYVPVFHSLENFDEFESSLTLKCKMRDAIEKKDNEEMLTLIKKAKEDFTSIVNNHQKMNLIKKMPEFMHRFTAGYVNGKIIQWGIENLKRKENHIKLEIVSLCKCLLAQNIFLKSKRGLLYRDLIQLLYYHLKKYELAVKYILEAKSDTNVNSVAQNAIHEQVQCILKHRKVPNKIKSRIRLLEIEYVDIADIQPQVVFARTVTPGQAGSKNIYKVVNGDTTILCSVEEVVIDYLKKNGYKHGLSDEGALLKSVLLSCFWDIIYDHPEYEDGNMSVFVNMYQTRPLDWETTSFYSRRETQIQERLDQIKIGGTQYIVDTVIKCCEENEGKNSVISWKYINRALLPWITGFIECLPIKFVVAAANHLLKDFRAFSSGFPDLTVWNPVTKKCIFVEVKANDSLSNKQKLWLKNINDFGGSATIYYVKDPNASSHPLKNKRAAERNSRASSGKKSKIQEIDSQDI